MEGLTPEDKSEQREMRLFELRTRSQARRKAMTDKLEFLKRGGLDVVRSPYSAIESAFKDIEVDGKVVDEGIGPHEFWGSKGTHHDYQFQVEETEGEIDLSILSLEPPVDEDIYECGSFCRNITVEDGNGFSTDYDVDVSVKLKSLETAPVIRPVKVGEETQNVRLWETSVSYTWSTE